MNNLCRPTSLTWSVSNLVPFPVSKLRGYQFKSNGPFRGRTDRNLWSGEYVRVESLAEVERGRKRLPREMADDECDRQTDEEDMNDQLG